MATPKLFLDYVDTHVTQFGDRLKEAVGYPSVSGDGEHYQDLLDMSDWLMSELGKYGVDAEKVDLPHSGSGQVPPAIFGKIGNDPAKHTILIYGHYDVQPASVEDGWTHGDPFQMDFDATNKIMYGRGTTDDKGPIMGWVNVLEAHFTLGIPLPVNLRFCFEGTEESGSVGLDQFIADENAKGSDSRFAGVDAMCIADNYWLNTRTPGVTYGLRGITCFSVTVSGPGADLHSGMFGGTVYEPMTALIALMSKLVTQEGRILIPNIYDDIPVVTEEERERYDDIDYTIQDLDDAAGGDIAVSEDKVTALMARMRYPSLSMHGIEGAYSGPGTKTVIPASVTGKFSLRLVPNQTVAQVRQQVTDYVTDEFAKLETKCKLDVQCTDTGGPWVTNPQHPNYDAAIAATEAVYGCKPDVFREGGSIPVVLTFDEVLKVNVLLLPMGCGDDGAHSINEKLDLSNYINGTKLFGTYLYEVALRDMHAQG